MRNQCQLLFLWFDFLHSNALPESVLLLQLPKFALFRMLVCTTSDQVLL